MTGRRKRGLVLGVLLCAAMAAVQAASAAQSLTEKVPDAGSYELYLPAAEKGKQPPLLVWLHPAGGEANELVTRWWPELYEMGWALLLPKSKTPQYWEFGEDKTILAYVAHAVKQHGVDGKRVVLFGFSAGGQMAFHMGMVHGARLAGIVTTSAVPVKNAQDLTTPLPPPACKDSLAYFMVVGEQEAGGAEIAKRAQLELLADGFSALLHVVKGAGHAFHESEKKNILAWLGEVAAGKRPAADEIKELAKEAPERIKGYREDLRRREELRKELTAVAAKMFDDIQGNLGKPYALAWKQAGEVEHGSKLKVMLPEGWKLGEEARNGDSAAVSINPPGDAHVVAYLGRSVKKGGIADHYQKWFATMTRENGMLSGKGGKLTINGHAWELHTFFLVPREKVEDLLARRVLVIAILPLNKDGTEWRSLTVMCPDRESATNSIAELVRGVLEKSDFGPSARPE